ncbi:MAG TPA: acyltransferase [Actinomycetales bacterium]
MSGDEPVAAPATGQIRLAYLDGVRALAAGYVVLHHIWFTVYPEYPRNTGPAALGWLVYGHLAVAVFIVVSGFSLTIAPARRGYRLGGVLRFIRRRAWRILPPYWAALALSALVFGLLTPQLTGSAITAKGVVVHALLLQDVIDSAKPNGAFWSIAIEWQIYFLFPLVLLARRRTGVVPTVAVACGAVVLAQVLAGTYPALQGLTNLTPQFFALFVLGSASAAVVHRPRAPRGAAAAGAAGFAAFAVLAWAQGPVWVDRHYFSIDLFIGVATAALLAGLSQGQLRALRSVLSSRPLTVTGAYSYSIYLVHLPLLWLVGHFVVDVVTEDAVTRFVLLLLLGVPAVLVGSYGFHVLFERPFLQHRSLKSLRDNGFRGAPLSITPRGRRARARAS